MHDLGDIRTRLAALRARVAAALAIEGGARLLLVLFAAVALSFLLDRFFKLETVARAVLLAGGLFVLGWASWRFLVRRLRGLPGEDPLAVAVEARFPELGDRLISALQLARETAPERYGMSAQLIEDAVKEAIEPARHVRFEQIVARGRVARVGLAGLLSVLLLAGAAFANREAARIWFQRNVLLRNVRWPQKTYLVVDPERFPDGVARIVRGADLVVVARSTGRIHPERVQVFYRDSEGEGGQATMKVDVTSHVYRHEFREVAYPIVFHLEGGDEETDDFRIELLEPPEIAALTVEVGFPAYAGREPEAVDLAAGDPEMLRGGFVLVHGRSTKPLEAAELVLGDTEQAGLAATLMPPDAFALRFAPEETVLAGVRLRDTDGLSNPTLAPRFLVRVVDDRPPRVNFTKVGIGTMVVAGAVLPYRVRAHDDVKVASGHIELRPTAADRPGEPFRLDLPAAELGVPGVELSGAIELAPLRLEPETFLSIGAFARDNAEPEAQEGRSDFVTVKVVTLEELFSELTRRQQEQRRLFEELILKERRLRDRFRDLRDAPPASPTEIRLHLENQAQEQREVGRGVRTIARAMEQILDEMIHNRVYDPTRVEELRRAVVEALDRLHAEVMEGHARTLDDHARRAAAISLAGDDGAVLDAGYERVLAAMEAVKERMIKVEEFTEVVERVRGILKLQEEVREATRRRYEALMAEIFGPPEEGTPEEGPPDEGGD